MAFVHKPKEKIVSIAKFEQHKVDTIGAQEKVVLDVNVEGQNESSVARDKKKSFSEKVSDKFTAQTEGDILTAASILTGFYIALNVIMIVIYFVQPTAFEWTLFEDWTFLMDYKTLYHVLNSIWFALVVSGAVLVWVGIATKRDEFLMPHLILASIEFSQILVYAVAFFALKLASGFFQEKNQFGINSKVGYVFAVLGSAILLAACCMFYFLAFIGIVFQAKQILKKQISSFGGVPDM